MKQYIQFKDKTANHHAVGKSVVAAVYVIDAFEHKY